MKNKSKMIINKQGKLWFLNNKYHREDGPAVELTNGYKSWWLNGIRHRIDGPAIEYANGKKSWYLNGEKVTEMEVMINMNSNITEREYIKFVINL